jgi:hypothetical protein
MAGKPRQWRTEGKEDGGERRSKRSIPQPCPACRSYRRLLSRNFFWWLGMSKNPLAQRNDKKKADPKTSRKVFRRGCLKGTVLLSRRPFLCNCEGRNHGCRMCNRLPGPISAGAGKANVRALALGPAGCMDQRPPWRASTTRFATGATLTACAPSPSCRCCCSTPMCPAFPAAMSASTSSSSYPAS